MKTKILIFISIISCFDAFSQQLPDSISKTKTDFPIALSKYTGGLDISCVLFGIGSSANFEGLLFRNQTGTKTFYARMGVGYYMIGDVGGGLTEGIQIPISLVYLSGKKNHHFEADLGIRTIFPKENYHLLGYPILNIGYRYQRPGHGVLFKTLVGTDGLTLGVGYAF